jgi:predicted PurR-regulated permease PerM
MAEQKTAPPVENHPPVTQVEESQFETSQKTQAGERIIGTRIMVGQGVRALHVAACLAIVIAALKASSDIFLPFLLALFIALLSMPMVSWLKSKGLPNLAAVLIATLVDVAIVVGASFLVIGSINEFAAEVPEYNRRLGELVARLQLDEATRGWLNDRGIATPQQWIAMTLEGDRLTVVAQHVLSRAASVLSGTLLVVLVTVFIMLEASTFATKLGAAFGTSAARKRSRSIAGDFQRYLGLKALTSAVAGLVVGLWCWFLGVQFALLLGLLMFLLHFIPNLGAFIAAVPACLIALVQLGPGPALAVALGYLAVGIIIGSIIEPPLMGRQFGLSALVVLLSLVFWGWVWGPVGMFLSVPLTMAVKIMLEYSDEFRPVAILLGTVDEVA